MKERSAQTGSARKSLTHASNSDPLPLNYWHIRRASRIVKQGGLIAYPTEAVYGLGCSPWLAEPALRLLRLKRRSIGKGLIVVAAHTGQLEDLVDFEKILNYQEVTDTWPGPVTWLLPARRNTPAWIHGDHTDIAVRVSADPFVRHLCEYCGPLISTSANPDKAAPARSSAQVRNYFRHKLDFIVPGRLSDGGSPSEIRDGRSGRIIRPGA